MANVLFSLKTEEYAPPPIIRKESCHKGEWVVCKIFNLTSNQCDQCFYLNYKTGWKTKRIKEIVYIWKILTVYEFSWRYVTQEPPEVYVTSRLKSCVLRYKEEKFSVGGVLEAPRCIVGKRLVAADVTVIVAYSNITTVL